MNNKTEIQNLLKKWQAAFNLQSWMLDVKFVDFKRTDYQQSGDIKVDLKKKKATILISNNPKYGYEQIIVHELVHLSLWEYDHFCENIVPKNKKDRYFDLLEAASAKFTKILLQSDRKQGGK